MRSSGTRKTPAFTASAERANRTGAPSSRIVPPSVAIDAEQRVREFGAPRADQAGQSQNLAAVEVDVDFVERESLGAELLHRKDDVAARHCGGRVGDLELAADHQLDHRVMGDLASPSRWPTSLPSRKHDDAVACLHHLVQPMRDEHHRDAVRLERGDHLEQLLGFGDAAGSMSARPGSRAANSGSAPWRSRPVAVGQAKAGKPRSTRRSSPRAGRDRAAPSRAVSRCR